MIVGPIAVAIFAFAAIVDAQSIAIVTPNESALDRSVAESTRSALTGRYRVQDLDMANTAFSATGRNGKAFNMTADDARNVASVLGCDLFILIKSGTQRRASIDTPDRFESFAVFFVVSGRTGRLIKWLIVSENAKDDNEAKDRLSHIAIPAALTDAVAAVWKSERTEPTAPAIEQVPEDGSPAAKNFRSPVPYRRVKPEYTRTAYLYDITATVEATVDLDEKGQVTRLEITRWAGYELDESVIKAIRSMNWRQAERNGRLLPIRFLLRYNFKKIEKDDPDNE